MFGSVYGCKYNRKWGLQWNQHCARAKLKFFKMTHAVCLMGRLLAPSFFFVKRTYPKSYQTNMPKSDVKSWSKTCQHGAYNHAQTYNTYDAESSMKRILQNIKHICFFWSAKTREPFAKVINNKVFALWECRQERYRTKTWTLGFKTTPKTIQHWCRNGDTKMMPTWCAKGI